MNINDAHAAVNFIIEHAPKYAQAKAERIYLEIPGWPEYEINQDGQIRRVVPSCGTRAGRELKWNKGANGYFKVGLCRGSNRKEYFVHRLVAMTFIGDPKGFDVCHFDGDKSNNSLENLRIDTRKGNMADQIRMNKTPRGEKCSKNKYKESFIRQLKDELSKGVRPAHLAKKYNMPAATVYGISSGTNWGWL